MARRINTAHSVSRPADYDLPRDWKPEIRYGDCFRFTKKDRIFGMQRKAVKIPDDLLDKEGVRPVWGFDGWEWHWIEAPEHSRTANSTR